MAYGFYYDLDLFSDFTYFLTDTDRGDQFEQQDSRWVAGLDARHTIFSQWFGRDVENTFGLQVRNDWINNGLYQTEDRVRVDKIDSTPPATDFARHHAKRIDFTDTQVGRLCGKQNPVGGQIPLGRGHARRPGLLRRHQPGHPGQFRHVHQLLPSPKLSLIFGPWAKTEFYAQGGFSFHSNDGRGATQTVEPVSADNPFPGHARRKNSRPGPNQRRGNRRAHPGRAASAKHRFALVSAQRFRTAAGRRHRQHRRFKKPSNRYGVEWANYYTPVEHLAFDFDLADSIARFTSVDADDAAPGSPGGTRVPEAVGAGDFVRHHAA